MGVPHVEDADHGGQACSLESSSLGVAQSDTSNNKLYVFKKISIDVKLAGNNHT